MQTKHYRVLFHSLSKTSASKNIKMITIKWYIPNTSVCLEF
jgi:hypothetical protein